MNPQDVVVSRMGVHRKRAAVAGVVGGLALLAGAFIEPGQFFLSYLWAYMFCLGVALGSMALLMVYYLTGGAWGFVAQRIFEAATRLMPALTLLFVPVLLGVHSLYPWSHPDIAKADGAIAHKSLYLNVGAVVARVVFYFAVWNLWAWMLNRWSREYDRTGDPLFVSRLRLISGPGIVLYGLTMTFASIDWIMSLEPHWSSSIYGAIFLVGQGLTALSFAVLVLWTLSRTEPLAGVATVKPIHDLGNLILAFVVLWAYVAVSQLIIIWSGNLPREISWYEHRVRGGWSVIATLLVIFHFFFPFFFLLLRWTTMRVRNLARLAAFVLFMRLVDLFWLVTPARHQSQFHISWLDFAAPVGLVGITVALFFWQLAKRPLIPLHDPRLEEALERA